MAKNGGKKIQNVLKDSFRALAKRHGLSDEKSEEFVKESMDLLARWSEFHSSEERERAVAELFRKYDIEYGEDKKSGGSC